MIFIWITITTGVLVYTYILSLERVKCRSLSESNVTASSCFGGLFASVLGGETKQGKPASWDALLCSLLKLVNKLVQTPLIAQNYVSSWNIYCFKNLRWFPSPGSSYSKLSHDTNFKIVGIRVMCSPRDPRFVISNLVEVDFQDVQILSTSPPEGTLSCGVFMF